MTPEKFHLTFLRHGESVGNAEGFMQGHHDYPLTEKGRGQAASLAARWHDEEKTFDKIFSSPSARAAETAAIIAESLGLFVETDPIWMEWDNGRWAGMKREEARKKYPLPNITTPYHPAGETGESNWDVYLRAGKALHSVLAHPPGKYLIVGHGGTLSRLMFSVMGITPPGSFQGPNFPFANTGFTSVEFTPNNNHWWITGINDRSHIPSEEISAPYKIYFLRHGESEGNLQDRFQGQAEYPLTPKGVQQAHALTNQWRTNGLQFDHIYASPQRRAKHTAEIIAEGLDSPLSTDPIWKEVDAGKMNGMNGDEIRAQFPERPDRVNVYSPIGTNGESWMSHYLRIGEGVQNIIRNPPGTYLIVSHGGTLNAAMGAIIGAPPLPNHLNAGLYFRNTGYVFLTYDPEVHAWRFISLGDMSHLSGVNNDA